MESSVLISGGHVMDPAQGINEVRAVCCVKDRMSRGPGEHCVEVDARGCYVFPGLIDYHTHLFLGGDFFGINADLQLACGVTTAVDAGSTGALNFEVFRRDVIERADIRIKALINICAFGNPGGGYHEELAPSLYRVEEIRRIFEVWHPNPVCGLKIRISKEVMGTNGMSALDRTIELADELNVPLVVHIPNPFGDIGRIVDRLRPGDTVAHVYHGKGQTLLDGSGRVRQEFQNARARGVLFDVANACSNCDHRVAQRAIADGFFPDIISTDLTALGYAKPHMVKNLPFVMSKFLALGMDLEAVVSSVTAVPARALGMEGEIGTLRPGAVADITICELREAEMLFSDLSGNCHRGTQVLVPVMTIHNGKFVYCSPAFN